MPGNPVVDGGQDEEDTDSNRPVINESPPDEDDHDGTLTNSKKSKVNYRFFVKRFRFFLKLLWKILVTFKINDRSILKIFLVS